MSVPSKTIDQLIINSPYEEPREHWKYDRESRLFNREPGRRPAGYVRASDNSKAFDDPGIFVELPLPNKIRPRVKSWREAAYPGVSGITKRLLEHWRDPEQRENRRLFFCQLEAISYPQDKRFSKNIFIVAPGLTVKNRLQVLIPGPADYYKDFSLIPSGLEDALRQGKVRVTNWHGLDWDSEERITKRKSVDKRGALSDEAYVREVMEDMATAQNIVVINDEPITLGALIQNPL